MTVAAGLSEVRRRAAIRRQQGFTLIELSIVLTIIGLIVGGILKGQELINNARLKTQVAQVDAIKSAVYTFQDRYGALPGDYTLADPNLGFVGAGTNGDGNGAVAAAGAVSLLDAAAVDATEAVGAWEHLVGANLLAGYVLPAGVLLNALNDGAGGNLPGKISGSFAWLATFSNTPVGGTARVGLMVRLQGNNLGAPTPSMREPDAAGIDLRYDDGSPVSGSITTGSTSAATCEAAGVYTLAGGNPSTNYCIMMFLVQ